MVGSLQVIYRLQSGVYSGSGSGQQECFVGKVGYQVPEEICFFECLSEQVPVLLSALLL